MIRHAVLGAGTAAGFVATYVAKSYLAPHQCTKPPQYFMRSGSNFEPVPHAVLAGMFGRPPQPNVFHMWSTPPVRVTQEGVVHFEVGLMLTNRSSAVARDVYLSVMILGPGGTSRIAVRPQALENWTANHVFGCMTQLLAPENYRLAPHQIIQPLILAFALAPPFPERFHIKISLGCSGSPLKQFVQEVWPDELQILYDRAAAAREHRAAGDELVRRMIGGIDDPEGGKIYEEVR
jgi:hypothetical protein